MERASTRIDEMQGDSGTEAGSDAVRSDEPAGTGRGVWEPSRLDQVLSYLVPALGPALAVALGALIVVGLSSSSVTLWATGVLINLAVAVGMYIFIGNSGIMSFGQVAFMAIGAYTSGILTIPPATKSVLMASMPGFLRHAQVAVGPSILIGGLVATVVAGALCLPLMKMSGLRAAMATFAILQIVYFVASNWNAVTLGNQGLINVPTTVTLPIALGWAIVCIFGAHAYQVSKSGVRLKGSREDEAAAAAVGVNIGNERRVGFVLSAFVIGVSGGLYGHWIGTFAPGDFYINLTFLLFAMLVVGGIKSLGGVTLGVLVLSGIQEGCLHIEAATNLTGLTEITLALVLLTALIRRPSGITRGKELEWRYVKDGLWPRIVRVGVRWRGGGSA